VAGTAGTDTLTGTLQFDIVALGDLQQRFANVGVDVGLDGIPVVVHKGDVDQIGVVVIDVGSSVPSLVECVERRSIIIIVVVALDCVV